MSVNNWTRRGLMASVAAGAAVSFTACAPRAVPTGHAFDPGQFQRWDETDPPFRIHPGDEVEVTLHSAAELSRTVQVGPDGRVNLPMIGAVMVSDRTVPEATAEITDRYSSVLVDPVVELLPASFGAQRIIVGGEVANPGLVELPGPRIGALEAVMLAGGFQPTARRNEVVVLRRANDGGVMLRTVDLHAPLIGRGQDPIPLVRHDMVFVPRSTIAEVNLWVNQYVRGILPLDAGFNYLIYESFRD
jgi:protein involved in polysaccharide export with SLBB domain